jgi:hypothetical protein
MNDKTYATFDLSEINVINFDEINQTSQDTIRTSVDGLKGIISWIGEIPSSILELKTLSPLYNQSEMIEVCSTSEWTSESILPLSN